MQLFPIGILDAGFEKIIGDGFMERRRNLDERRRKYPEKFASEEVIFGYIHRGERIFVGTGCGEAQYLVVSPSDVMAAPRMKSALPRKRIPKLSRSNMKIDKIQVLYEQLHKGPFRLRDGTPVIKLVPKDKDKVIIYLPGGQTTEVYKRQLRKLLIRNSVGQKGNIQKIHDASDKSLQ